MTPLDAAWLAGFLDGDGCIGLMKRGPMGWRSPVLSFDSADIELLERVRLLIGGSIYPKTRVAPQHRQAYTIKITGSTRVADVMEQVLPHLSCEFKRERARRIIEDYRRVTPRNGHYTDESRKAKEQFEADFLALGDGRGSRSR